MFVSAAPVLFLLTTLLPAQPAPAKPKPALPPDQVAQTTRYLAALATPMGGYAPQAGGKASLRATLGAVRGLRLLGVQPADLAACRDFVVACLTPEGFADGPDQMPGPSAATLQAVGIMALHDLGAEKLPQIAGRLPEQFARLETLATDFETVRLAAAAFEAGKQMPAKKEAWLALVQKAQSASPENARLVGGSTAARLRLGAQLQRAEREELAGRLMVGQKEDGGWANSPREPSDLDSCYRVMRAIRMLGAQPNAEKLRAFVASCRNADGGYGVAKGNPSSVSATYQALIVLSWLE